MVSRGCQGEGGRIVEGLGRVRGMDGEFKESSRSSSERTLTNDGEGEEDLQR